MNCALTGAPEPEEGRGYSRREGRRRGRSSSGTAPPFKPRTTSTTSTNTILVKMGRNYLFLQQMGQF